MATISFTAVRRLAGFAFTLTLICLCLTGTAFGQGTPLVTATAASGLGHPTGWGQIQQSAIDSMGDWFVVDVVNGSVYEFPSVGGAALSISGVKGLGGGYENPAIAIDPNNNIYLGANWNNGIVMFPYVAATNSWTGLSTLSPSNPTIDFCTNSGKGNLAQCWAQYGLSAPASSAFPGYFQPWGLAIGSNDTLLVGNQNSGNFIFSLGVNGAWANPTAGAITTEEIAGMTARPISIAQDPEGNIYAVEDYSASSYLPGVIEIPAGSSGLASDAGLVRVDPDLPAVTGVIVDSVGNLYVSDSQVGVVMIPNPAGTPQTASAVVVSGVPAVGEAAIDWSHNLVYVPTAQTQSNGQADVAQVGIGSGEFGSSAVGTTLSTGPNVVFGFNGNVTPASFSIVEDGVANGDFAITGGTCTTGTVYAVDKNCLENVSFTPHSVGSISAKLLMLDAKSNILASMVLHGTGVGANIQATPSFQSTIGGSLKTPGQVAVDAVGNVYVADSGLGKVLEFAVGSGASSAPVSIGTGLTAPTGVAVDGSGDVFIADSGSVYEVPFGPSGLNAAGQVTLVAGLGTTGLRLAADGSDHLYVSDPSNGRVVKLSDIGAWTTSNLGQSSTFLTTGFTAPSAVAVDTNNNLYVIDGANLFEIAGGTGAPATWLNNLSGATSLAIDPSGAVYLSEAGGTVRIPLVSGVLVPANEIAIASSVTNPVSVTLDRWGNTYVADGTGLNVQLVSYNGAINVPTPGSLTSSTTATATIVNAGNSPLSVTGYTSTNAVDFSGADGNCVASSPLAAGGTCQVVVTFAPGPGEQGALTGTIGVTSGAVNSPIVINASATGLALSGSLTAANAASTAQVVSTPFTVAVNPKSGAGIPSGQVTVSYPSWTVTANSTGGTIVPTTNTVTATLDATGKASFTLSPVLAGSDTFTVSYGGDRTYGRSTITTVSPVAKSAIMGIQLPTIPDPTDTDLPFVTAGNGGGTVPYDGSELPWQYNFKYAVNTAAGVPTGTVTVMDNVTSCPPGTSAAGIGAATCALAGYASPGGYSGVACPNQSGSGILPISNSGTPTGALGIFATECLWYVPQGVSYSPVIFTHYISPVYGGDVNFIGLTGPTATVIQSVRGPVLQITQTGNSASRTSAPTLSVSPGSTASMNLTLTSMLGYGIAGANGQLNASNFPVTLSCDNLPPHTQCSFTYPNPDPLIANAVDIPCPAGATTTEVADGSVSCTAGQASVTIYTDVSAGTTVSMNARRASVALAAIFGFGMIGLFFRRRAFDKARTMMMVLLMIAGGALAVSITACNTTTLAPQASLATPAGTYAVTITASEAGTLCVSSPGAAGDNCIVPGSGATSDNGILVYGSQNQVSLPFYINLTVQ
jgi:hypothetical protein